MGKWTRPRELFGDRGRPPLRLTEHVWRTRFASFSDWLDLYLPWYGLTNQTLRWA